MPYKILDLYRDLPGTNCGDCGRVGCLAFAGAVFLEGAAVAGCSQLPPDRAAALQARCAAATVQPARAGSEPTAETVATLLKTARSRGFAALAAASGVPLRGDGLQLTFLGQQHTVTTQEVSRGQAPCGPRAAAIILHYVLHSRAAARAERWIPHFQLSQVGDTLRRVHAATRRLAHAFAGRCAELDRRVAVLGGTPVASGSAKRAYRIAVLPRVEVLLRFWDVEEDTEGRALVGHSEYGRFTSAADFDARAEFSLDAFINHHLEPEPLCSLLMELVDRLVAE